MQGIARVGGHVTLIFSVQDDSELLLEQGSRGAGLALDRGVVVEARAKPGKGSLTIEGDAPSSELHDLVLEELKVLDPTFGKYDWNLKHVGELPASQGFGLSAAGAIACALSIQRALDVDEEIARSRSIHVAHRVERRLSGGLGDVAALHASGVELRLEPGCPQLRDGLGGPGAVLSWHEEIPLVVVWRTTSSQHTSNYIDDGEWKLAIRAAGEHCLFGLREGKWDSSRWSELLSKSAEFAERSGLLADSGRIDLLHLIGGALAGAGFADGSLVTRLCMLGESAVIVPSKLPLSEDWQDAVIDHLEMRGLGAASASVASDAINLELSENNN
jgi:pantoate kinase